MRFSPSNMEYSEPCQFLLIISVVPRLTDITHLSESVRKRRVRRSEAVVPFTQLWLVQQLEHAVVHVEKPKKHLNTFLGLYGVQLDPVTSRLGAA